MAKEFKTYSTGYNVIKDADDDSVVKGFQIGYRNGYSAVIIPNITSHADEYEYETVSLVCYKLTDDGFLDNKTSDIVKQMKYQPSSEEISTQSFLYVVPARLVTILNTVANMEEN